MEKRTLHHTDLTVSKLCMGTANFGTVLSQSQVNEHLDLFWEHGGNFLDTAHVYSNWIPGETSRSEKMIGRWMKHHNRSDVILCTKGGHYDFGDEKTSRITPKQLAIDLEESLNCLQTEYIDVYMLHRDNPTLPVDEIMDCLNDFAQGGRIRYLACSNWSAARTAKANAYARKSGKRGFVINQLMWSMASINPAALPEDYIVMDEEMLRFGLESGMNFMCFSALAKGYFTRRYAGKPISDELHKTYGNAFNDQQIQKLLSLPNSTMVTHECLRFFDRQPVAAIPVVAFSGKDQLLECMNAFKA